VEGAHLGHDRKLPDGPAVDVTRDMGQPLVPDDELDVLPAELGEHRVHAGPAELGVPEPQRAGWPGGRRPARDVPAVPAREILGPDRVAVESAYPVGAVADDRRGGRPVPVGVERIATEQVKPSHELALYDVDGEAATRGLLVLVVHVEPGSTHGGD